MLTQRHARTSSQARRRVDHAASSPCRGRARRRAQRSAHGQPRAKRRRSMRRASRSIPKRAHGTFRTLKWIVMAVTLGIYYLTPWLRWDRGPDRPDQAVLVDFPIAALLLLLHRDLAAGILLRRRPADHGRRSACSWSPRSSAASGAATPARRRSGPTSSSRSSA